MFFKLTHLNIAALALEDPLEAFSLRNTILNYFDFFFTTVFTIELLIKVSVRIVSGSKYKITS